MVSRKCLPEIKFYSILFNTERLYTCKSSVQQYAVSIIILGHMKKRKKVNFQRPKATVVTS